MKIQYPVFKTLFAFILLFIYFFVFFSIGKFNDKAYFGGDVWEYQSMAVNFAYGHGINKFGELEAFETYKFDKKDTAIYNTFRENAGNNNFYRTPIYPLFVGIIYKIGGIKPLYAKCAQLLLLIIVAISLPFIGEFFWGKLGCLSGYIASPLFLLTNYRFTVHLLTESLLIFIVFLTVVVFLWNQRKRNITTALALGFVLGLTILMKGSLIFIPVFIIIFCFYESRKQKNFKLPVIVSAMTILTILPWSSYASITSNQLIIISTQGKTAILDGHNEYNVNGLWSPQWKDHENSFYNRSKIRAKKTYTKLLYFYFEYPSYFLKLILLKLNAGFFSLFFFNLIFMVSIIIVLKKILLKYIKRTYTDILTFLLSVHLILFLLITPEKQIVLFFQTNLYKVFLPLLLGFVALIFFSIREEVLTIPAIFVILFLNFLLINTIFFVDNAIYNSRFVKPMDFIFCLSGIYLTLRIVFDTIYNDQRQITNKKFER